MLIIVSRANIVVFIGSLFALLHPKLLAIRKIRLLQNIFLIFAFILSIATFHFHTPSILN